MERAAILPTTLPLTLAGCSAAGPGPNPREEFLSSHGLADMEMVEIIDRLHRVSLSRRSTDPMASVRTGELLLSDSPGEITLDLAPTHDRFRHSLTTGAGEPA